MSNYEGYRDTPEQPIDDSNYRSVESLLYCLELNQLLDNGYDHEDGSTTISWTSYEASAHIMLKRYDNEGTPTYVLFYEKIEHHENGKDQDSYITITPGEGVTSIEGCVVNELSPLEQETRNQAAEVIFRELIDTYREE